jgi:hypothetical protein
MIARVPRAERSDWAERRWTDVRNPNLRGWDRIRSWPGRFAFRALNSASYHMGFRLVRDSYYSPLVDLDSVPREQPLRPMPGIAFDSAEQLGFMREVLGPFLSELDIPDDDEGGALHLHNGAYEAGDAETLYAFVRARRPARVLEIGSGNTTRIIARALAANGAGEHVVYDPFAAAALDQLADIRRISASEIADSEFAALAAGDILFVDSTHIVKLGSEVNRVVLEALPTLATGVAIHFHDIFLPWEYPFGYFVYQRMYVNEQYLLQAFLALNPDYRILLALQAVGRLHPTEMAELIPSVRRGAAPAAFWIERTAGGAQPPARAADL